jgi:hypothetical protein
MREKTLDRCFCGRTNGPVRQRVIRDVRYTARFCIGACPPLNHEEQSDPGMRAWHGKGFNPDFLDVGIRDRVLLCRERGWASVFSCDGHGKKSNIMFWSRTDAEAARAHFAVEDGIEGVLRTVDTSMLGQLVVLDMPPPQRWGVKVRVYLARGTSKEDTYIVRPLLGPLSQATWNEFRDCYSVHGQVTDAEGLLALTLLDNIEEVRVTSPLWWAQKYGNSSSMIPMTASSSRSPVLISYEPSYTGSPASASTTAG